MAADEAPDAGAVRNGGAPTARRRFLLLLGAGLLSLAGLILALPLVGSLVSAVLRRTPWQAWIALGEVESFPEGETRLATYRNPFVVPWDGATGDIPCWVRRIGADRFQIFAVHCTHLGCPVRWFPESALFMCPCHGGVFYEDGRRAAGPPPRGLYQYEHRVRGGKLWVRGGRIPILTESV